MMNLRQGGLLALALTLTAPALAEEPAHHHPLKPGKAAGVVHAQEIRSGIALVAAGSVIAVVALVAGTSGGGGGPAKPQSETVPVTTGTP